MKEKVSIHPLWSKAVGTPGYVKEEWRAMADYLLELERIVDEVTAKAEYLRELATLKRRMDHAGRG